MGSVAEFQPEIKLHTVGRGFRVGDVFPLVAGAERTVPPAQTGIAKPRSLFIQSWSSGVRAGAAVAWYSRPILPSNGQRRLHFQETLRAPPEPGRAAAGRCKSLKARRGR